MTSLRHHLSLLFPELKAYARALCYSRADADDLVSDAVERGLRAAAAPTELAALRPWMFRVIRNLNVDELRKRRVRREYSDHLAREWDETSAHEGSVVDTTLGRIAFEKLEPAQREMLFLIDVMGMKYAEAAEVLGIPLGTVMSRVSRSRRAFVDLVRG